MFIPILSLFCANPIASFAYVLSKLTNVLTGFPENAKFLGKIKQLKFAEYLPLTKDTA